MDLAGTRYYVDVICRGCQRHILLAALTPSLQCSLELDGFGRAEIVTAADDIAAMRVEIWVKVAEDGQHFRGMSTAAKDYE